MTFPAVLFSRQIKHLRLHDEIVAILQKQILTGTLSPGLRLPPERELAESFKVNRATVREALRRLELMELLEIRHGDGVYVKDFLESSNVDLIKAMMSMESGNDMLANVLEVRRIMVPEMAYLAAMRRNAADVADLERIVADASISIMEKDLKLHQIIARATGNLLYVILLNFFQQLFRDYFSLYFEDQDNIRESRKFHERILEAVKNQKPKDARRIMEQVIISAEERIQKVLIQVHQETTIQTGQAGPKWRRT